MLQGGGREVCAYDQGPLASGEELASIHVWPVEGRQLYALSLGSFLDDQSFSPLRVASCRRNLRQSPHVVSQPVAEISLISYLGIRQNNYVKSANLYHPDGLRKTKAPAVAYVVGHER